MRALAAAALASLAALVVSAPAAAAPRVAVLVVPPFDLAEYAGRGAVGLLVPGAGSSVTRAGALAALERGEVRTALLGGVPEGEPLVRIASAPADVTVYVVLPPPGRHHNVTRYPVAIVGGGYRGLLRSSSTRIDGLLSIADVAPTAVALARGEPPQIRSLPAADAAADLRRLDVRLAEAHDARATARLVVVALLLAALAAAVLLRSRSAARAALLLPPLALGATLALSGLHEARLVVVAAGFALAGGLAAALGRHGDRVLVLVVSAFLAAFLGALAAWPSLNALGVLGPHPDGGGRYYGVTNEVETLLLAPTLAAAAAAGATGAPLVGLLALVAVGWSRAGADGGGVFVVAVAFAVLCTLLLRPRRPVRALVPAVVVAVALGFAFVALDRATGGASHVTDAVGSGSGLFADAVHRWQVSWEGATSSWAVAAQSLAGLLGLLAFALATPRAATVDALLAGIAVSLVVNDTPQDVLTFGALACAALWTWERLRPLPRRRETFVFRPVPQTAVSARR